MKYLSIACATALVTICLITACCLITGAAAREQPDRFYLPVIFSPIRYSTEPTPSPAPPLPTPEPPYPPTPTMAPTQTQEVYWIDGDERWSPRPGRRFTRPTEMDHGTRALAGGLVAEPG